MQARTIVPAGAAVWLLVASAASSAMAQAAPAPSAQQPPQKEAKSELSKGLQPGMAKAGDVIGKNVQDAQGERLGRIKDLVIDRSGERAAALILEPSAEVRAPATAPGAAPGAPPAAPGAQPGAAPPPSPDRYVALPWGMLGVADGKLVLANVEKSKLTPKFPDDRWPALNRQWVESVYQDFGQSYTAGAAQPGQQPASGPQAGDFVRASEFIGKNVKNQQGEKLGSVEDLVVDLKSGEVRYAVFAAGGFLGIGSKLFAIPLSEFSIAAEGKELALAADKERLQKAEGFKKDNWPMTASREWMQQGQRQQGQQRPQPAPQK